MCAKHGHHLHYAADVDGETRHAAGHLVAVGKSGADEEGGEDTVEFILLSVREAQGEDAVHNNLLPLLFPLPAQGPEGLLEVVVVFVELALPAVYGGHVVEQFAGE